MKRNVVNLTNLTVFLNSISLDSLCRKNGLTLDVWSQSLLRNELTPVSFKKKETDFRRLI